MRKTSLNDFYRYKYKYRPPRRFIHKQRNSVSADYYMANKYGISMHCVIRCVQRVFFSFDWVTGAKALNVAKWIVSKLEFRLDKVSDGLYPFIDGYVIVVKDRTAITIMSFGGGKESGVK